MIGNKQPITTTLVGMNAAVFAVMVLTGVSPVEPTVAQLLKWGANFGPLSLGAEPWRMLASNYIHIGIIHIALNMWCLWNLGFLAERVFDPWTYVLIYTACGLAGSLASLWWHPMVPGAGASGAIFGLAGALIAALYLGHLPISRQAIQGTLKSLLTFAGYNLFFGAAIKIIDNSAHIGGLLAGLALGAVLAKHLTQPAEVRDGWRRGVFVAAAVVLFLVFIAVKHASGSAMAR
jgi:rhomboid protease GluP